MMPFNLVGFCEATPGTGTVALNVGLNETLYKVVTDDLYVTDPAKYLLGVFGAGTSTLGDVLLRQPGKTDIAIKKTSLVGDLAALCSYTNFFGRPVTLAADKLNVYVVNATDEASIVGLLLGTGRIPQAALDKVSPTHVISGYSDTTVTAYTWSPCTVTWNQTLPKGTYEVIGMKGTIFGQTEMGLMRLLIPGNTEWRPGVPANQGSADHEEWQGLEKCPACDWSMMGVRFDEQHMPNIEVLACAADTDENVELTLQKVA